MNAQTVRRGSGAGSRPRKAPARASKTIAKALPVNQRNASRLAGWAFGLFVLAMAIVAIVALDVPAKAGRAVGTAMGDAGFEVDGYQIVGLKRMERRKVDAVVTGELCRAAAAAGKDNCKPPQALVDADLMREQLMGYGWVKDARVSRRLPDMLVIDIVERTPAALWQNKQQLSLVDADGIVLDRVPVDRMPDLPLLVGAGANSRADQLNRIMAKVPTLKPQLASATWIGNRRWDVAFQTGETVALPEGEKAATDALVKFAKMDRTAGLLGRDIKRFDLRVPGKMIVRLPRAPGETITETQEVPS